MKSMKLCDIIEKSINQARLDRGLDQIKLTRCKPVQICSNGRHKDISTGKFTH